MCLEEAGICSDIEESSGHSCREWWPAFAAGERYSLPFCVSTENTPLPFRLGDGAVNSSADKSRWHGTPIWQSQISLTGELWQWGAIQCSECGCWLARGPVSSNMRVLPASGRVFWITHVSAKPAVGLSSRGGRWSRLQFWAKRMCLWARGGVTRCVIRLSTEAQYTDLAAGRSRLFPRRRPTG